MPTNEETKEKVKEVTLDSVAKNMKAQPQRAQQVAPMIDQDDFFLPDPKARKPEKLDLKFVTNNQVVKADLMEELLEIQQQVSFHEDYSAEAERQNIAGQTCQILALRHPRVGDCVQWFCAAFLASTVPEAIQFLLSN